MTKRWTIRAAIVEDSDNLQQCMQSAYATYQARMGDRRLPPMDLNYVQEISNYPTWVAEHGRLIIGGLTMMFEDDYASIANVAVHPEFQGQGLGSGLMRFAETQALQKGYCKMRLATHILLNENLSLYTHLGWTELKRDDVRVYMQKDIK